MLEILLRILALTRKELLAILKDPRSRIVLFAPPIMQSLIFGYAASYDLNDVPYAVVDQDRTAASRELLSHLDGSGIFHRVADVMRPADVDRQINDRRALIVIQIDQDFERRLLTGRPANVQVIADGRNSNTAGLAIGYVGSIVDAFNADWRSKHGGAGAPPVHVVDRAWYNPNLESRWNMVPALVGTLTMLGTLILTALSVAREREQGTFDQLLVTPLRPAEVMAGKATPCMMVGLVQATSILLIAQFWFHIPFVGSYATLYLGLGLFLMAAVGLGLLVSSFAATMQQAMLYSFIVVMPFTLLSGLTTPISSMPQSFQTATLLNPLRYAIDIAHRVYLEGAGVADLLPDLWPLAVIGVLTLAFSAWLFRHRLT
jgi:ABC-2 type transport system permease protein